MRFQTHTLTSAGGRERNQDCLQYAVNEQMACWVLADGLGGHGGGEEAARVATDAAMAAFQSHAECSPAALMTYVEFAHNAVLAEQERDLSLYGMRTTIVALVCDAQSAQWVHVGDSRLYYFHQGRLTRQTRDHSVPQAMVDAGQIPSSAIRNHEDRNRLLRSLGGREEVRATIEENQRSVVTGDAFLLCSDGFWEYVTETAMELDLCKSATPAEWLRHMELRLRTAAPEDQDNFTAIAIFAGIGKEVSIPGI